MILKSEIIQENLLRLEKATQEFSFLKDYAATDDDQVLRKIWDEGKSYGLMSYFNFLDFIRHSNKTNQEIFYKNKITLPHFREILINNATDLSVKKLLKSKGKVSFTKFINSPKWDLYSGNRRRRGGVRYQDNFVSSASIIANFCIQNEIEVDDTYRISEYYRNLLPEIDMTIKKELFFTKKLIDYMVDSISESSLDFKRMNLDHISKFLSEELKKKLTEIDKGESVKLIEDSQYYGGLTFGKVYEVIDKEINSGRLQVIIFNDVNIKRSYPYRLFETVSNLRNSALDDLLEF